jgi:hypothetical protein
MPYGLIYSAQAEEDLGNLPADLLPFIEARLLDLARQPATLSRPSVSPPYPPGGQIYQCRRPHFSPWDVEHHFTVLFRYSQDETTLYILGIGHIEF